jgi:23S rRNA (uracil1939-C5)-methyltransferase
MTIQKHGKGKKNIENNLQVQIDFLNKEGDGIANIDNHKIAVQKVLPGEVITIKYLPQRPRNERIKLKTIIQTSPKRVVPPCPYFEECGGCQIQHMSYQDQLLYKKEILKTLLGNRSELKQIRVSPVVPMPVSFSYRNKTQMPFQKIQGKISYGLYKRGTHDIVPTKDCLVESHEANLALQTICKWAMDYKISVYDEKTGQGLLRYGIVRKGQFTNQVMVIIVTKKMESPFLKELLERLRAVLPSLRSLILNINSGTDNVILGNNNLKIWGSDFIEEKLGKVKYKIFPNTFFQTNSIQMERILIELKKLGNFNQEMGVLDLFCGVGTIGLYLAGNIGQLIGLENNQDSLKAAKQCCKENKITNASFIYGDLSNGFTHLLPKGFNPDCIIVDPPRKGLTPILIQNITQLQPEKVIYISCNPDTLVRDLAIFYTFSYFTETIHPFDMFPQTSHVESLVFIKKR